MLHNSAYTSSRDANTNYPSIKNSDSSYIENSIQVEYLKKNDAGRARRIIQGLITANKAGINLERVPPHILLKDIESLGQAQQVEINQ